MRKILNCLCGLCLLALLFPSAVAGEKSQEQADDAAYQPVRFRNLDPRLLSDEGYVPIRLLEPEADEIQNGLNGEIHENLGLRPPGSGDSDLLGTMLPMTAVPTVRAGNTGRERDRTRLKLLPDQEGNDRGPDQGKPSDPRLMRLAGKRTNSRGESDPIGLRRRISEDAALRPGRSPLESWSFRNDTSPRIRGEGRPNAESLYPARGFFSSGFGLGRTKAAESEENPRSLFRGLRSEPNSRRLFNSGSDPGFRGGEGSSLLRTQPQERGRSLLSGTYLKEDKPDSDAPAAGKSGLLDLTRPK